MSHHAAALPGCPSLHHTAGPSPASAPPPLLQEVAGAALRREQLHPETAGNGIMELTVVSEIIVLIAIIERSSAIMV